VKWENSWVNESALLPKCQELISKYWKKAHLQLEENMQIKDAPQTTTTATNTAAAPLNEGTLGNDLESSNEIIYSNKSKSFLTELVESSCLYSYF